MAIMQLKVIIIIDKLLMIEKKKYINSLYLNRLVIAFKLKIN